MTPLQIKVAIMINELGSISQAANELGISQPNASNYLKMLENEIGFPIFNRTKTGSVPTEKGNIFLIHAKKMMIEQESIMKIQKYENIFRLRLGTVNYYSAIEPFIKLCAKHRDDMLSDVKYESISIEEGMKELENYNLDIIFSPILKSQITGVTKTCKTNNLSIISLCELPATINIRKGHPMENDDRIKNITQGCDCMKDYPYVTYRNLYKDSTSTGYNDSCYIQSSYIIHVDEVDIRARMVSETNAFSIGMFPSRTLTERYNTVSFPIPGVTLNVICVVRKGEEEKKEIKEYLELLKEELNI